jgi:YHS domain-containing protein
MTARTYLTAVAFLLGGATLAASASTGEFGNECVMGLALGQDIATDCSVNTVLNGRTYCFGNEQAKSIFLKKPGEFLTKAIGPAVKHSVHRAVRGDILPQS